jgi:ATP-dependent DNA helicase RecG
MQTLDGRDRDNRQEHMNAFAMVREGMAFLERTMPLGARFPEGKIFREDRFPVPLDALREILLNAVMHRDYSHYSGYVAIVVFDDRIEIRSYGRLPNGVTVKQLSGRHDSKPTNPLIAGAFHRTGAVEVWGRGTNRVIAACEKHGAARPIFEERQGFVIVTFKTSIVPGAGHGSENSSEKGSEKSSEKILRWIGEDPAISARELARRLTLTSRAVEKQIGILKEKGRLRRIGPAKGGRWEVIR